MESTSRLFSNHAVPAHTLSSSIDPGQCTQLHPARHPASKRLQCGTAWTGHKLTPSPLHTSKTGLSDRYKGRKARMIGGRIASTSLDGSQGLNSGSDTPALQSGTGRRLLLLYSADLLLHRPTLLTRLLKSKFNPDPPIFLHFPCDIERESRQIEHTL